MRKIVFIITLFFSLHLVANMETQDSILERPLVERYILDELKALRTNQQKLKEDVTVQITQSQLSNTDRTVRYATDTINNIFYIIAAATSLLLLVGFKSLKELKENSENLVERKILKLTLEFENRLLDIENNAKQRFEMITENQDKITQSETINSLWKRAEIEENLQEKINLYDEIIEINPHDVVALAYKADVLLDLNETRWALSLCNKAIELDNNYALSYWQRACANATLENINESLDDIKMALEISPNLQEELENEESFEKLQNDETFKKLIS
jgi:tetratricopeptide (TPR) repeat protein